MFRLISPVCERVDGEDACMIWQTLQEHPGMLHGALVHRVGDALFRHDLEAIGGAADIGFFRPFYLTLARQRIAGLDGSLLRIGASA